VKCVIAVCGPDFWNNFTQLSSSFSVTFPFVLKSHLFSVLYLRPPFLHHQLFYVTVLNADTVMHRRSISVLGPTASVVLYHIVLNKLSQKDAQCREKCRRKVKGASG